MMLRPILHRSLYFVLPLTFLGFTEISSMASDSDYNIPFNSCATMQAHFNSLEWDNETRFEGFQNRKFESHKNYEGVSNVCRGGYITEMSPLGKLICYGYIAQVPKQRYDIPGFKHKASYHWGYGNDSDSVKGENCRWKE
jgi:hypothetical protein